MKNCSATIIFQIGRIFFQLFQCEKKKCSKREQERRSIPTLDPSTGIRSDCNFDKLRWKLRERRVWRRPRLIGQVSAKRIVDITAHPSLPNYLSFERRQKKKKRKKRTRAALTPFELRRSKTSPQPSSVCLFGLGRRWICLRSSYEISPGRVYTL